MYADKDSRGTISIMEMSSFERNTLLEAMEKYAEILQDTTDLLGEQAFFTQQKNAVQKFINEIRTTI